MTTITAQWLRDHGACEAGIESFIARLGENAAAPALDHLRHLAAVNPSWGIWEAVRLPEFTREVMGRWMLYILADPENGVERLTTPDSPTRAAVEGVSDLYRRELAGDPPASAEWAAAAGWAEAAGWAKAAEAAGAWAATWAAAAAAWSAAAWAAEAAGWAASQAAAARAAWAAEAWAAKAAAAYLSHLIVLLETVVEQTGGAE